MKEKEVDVLVVGGGPSGLAAAIQLRREGIASVLVVEREEEAGGIPRHSHHIGFGLRDMNRIMFGPHYARRYVDLAARVGAVIQTRTMVTDWTDRNRLITVGPEGRTRIRARAVVLATGCRERPRSARQIPGTRPQGIFTTGTLQQYVYSRGHPVGSRAVIVGAEHVSFSAVLTLQHAGVSIEALVTELPRHQTFFFYKLVTTDRYRIPIITDHEVSQIRGKGRVEAVELTHIHTGAVTDVPCDTVVFTGDWIPDNELSYMGRLVIDPGTKGPQVDISSRTSVKGVFAVGNLIHAAETADRAALSGRNVAPSLRRYLETGEWGPHNPVPILYDEPIRWVSPSVIVPFNNIGRHNPFFLRVSQPLSRPTLKIKEGNKVLWQKQYRSLMPNLSISVPAHWLKNKTDAQPVGFEVV